MHEITQQPEAPEPENLSQAHWPGGPNEGDWVLLAVVAIGQNGQEAVPVMEPKRRMVMRRYRSAEEAIGASVCHSATRVGGGWALNVRTGHTVKFDPFRGDRHV